MLWWLALAALAVIMAGCVSAADAQQHDASKDFDILNTIGNGDPVDIWANSTTMWVADQLDYRIYAYKMSDKTRDMSKEFHTTLSNAGNYNLYGIWSDGTTMWVSDTVNTKLYAYRMSDKMHDQPKDFDTLSAAGNDQPYGIWSDGKTMWVADHTDNHIYAYKMSDKTRDMSKEFNLTQIAVDNDAPTGIWSDGRIMWVVDNGDDHIYAYKMSDQKRDKSREINTLSTAGNTNPTGIWSDGRTLWVSNDVSGANIQVYAYKLPPPPQPPQRTFVYVPPPDRTPPTIKSVERTGNVTITTDRALTWDVTFSERVYVDFADVHTNHTPSANVTIPDLGMIRNTVLVDVPEVVAGGHVSVDLTTPSPPG